MRTHKSFRPAGVESLEDRTVLNGGGLGSLLTSVPAQDARLVAQEFATFQRAYTQDVQNVLFASGATPTAQRAAFDAAVARDLTTLDSAIDNDIHNLPAYATLKATIHDELLGTSSGTGTGTGTSLQAELASVPTPTGTNRAAQRGFLAVSGVYTGLTAAQVVKQVATSPAPAGAVSADTLRSVLGQVNDSFNTFRRSYDTEVRTVLFASGTTPTAQRAAFDAAVANDLQTLRTGVVQALGALPPALASSLTTTLTNDLLTGTGGAGAQSLQSKLAALTTPRSSGTLASLIFRGVSFVTTGLSQAQVVRDIAAAVNDFNATPPANA